MSCPICGLAATTALRPCGHCLCQNCLVRVTDCPMCRSPIESNIRIYLDQSTNLNFDNNLINLSNTQINFLKQCCPNNGRQTTLRGLVLGPLIKLNTLAPNLDDELPELITRLAVPTLNPTMEVRQLLSGFYSRRFVTQFVKIMRSRMQIYIDYGISAIKVSQEDILALQRYIESIELNYTLRDFLLQISDPYPATGIFKNLNLIEQEQEEDPIEKDQFIKHQLDIIKSVNTNDIKRFAIKNLIYCYSNLFSSNNQQINNIWSRNHMTSGDNSTSTNNTILDLENLTTTFSDSGNYWWF